MTTLSPATGLLPRSVTVAVAVLVDVPLATIDGGESETSTVVAGPAASAVGTSSKAPSATHTPATNPCPTNSRRITSGPPITGAPRGAVLPPRPVVNLSSHPR